MSEPRTVERQVEYGASMYASGKEAGAREEREAVAKWLRDNRGILSGIQHRRDEELIAALADYIAAGEHRKEADLG